MPTTTMSGVRRFELGDGNSARLRLRDDSGLPLLDAHTEPGALLRVAVPENWAHGATVERSQGGPALDERSEPKLYAVPEPPALVTLAALQDISANSASRGPDETFHTLFAEPFGANAVSSYVAARRDNPPAVYGVSREDAERMALVLDQIARSERNKRLSSGIGGIGFGAIMGGAGVALLRVDPKLSHADRTEDRVIGGTLLGLGGALVLTGAGSLFLSSDGERTAAGFQRQSRAGDTSQAFAEADKRLQELVAKRRAERVAGVVFGAAAVAGCTTGLVVSELGADTASERQNRALGWGAGIVGGGMLIGSALFMESASETLAKIWKEDPSLNQYQPSVSFDKNGAFLGLAGTL
jgi:hypothetical protein